jgi:NAD(P)-dependent dehydrogenase (short-subunit alcohol dehydrogenase family)
MNDPTQANTKVALVTGANRGIGWETARELGELGIHVILGSRDLAQGRRAAALLSGRGFAAEAIQLDVTAPADHRHALAWLSERFGKLDILVNNAGILVRDSRSITASEDLRRVFETNFFGTVELTQALLPLIRKSPAGRIVNVSSIVGSLTLHSDPQSRIYHSKIFSYDASKSALNAFTVHLAYDLRDTAIKVNSADPGWVKTEMGGEHALVELWVGGKTRARLATLPPDGPNGGYFRLDEAFPW